MGYTHYWKFNQQPTPEKFTEFVEGAKADNCDSLGSRNSHRR
jgi:hypothetical protein